MLFDLLRLRCPVCRQGTVFRGPYSMNADCPHCGIHFERENGYFLGAMVFAYVLGVVSVIPTIILLVRFYEADTATTIFVPILQLILLQPLIYVYSRMIWMYVDRNANRKNWQ
ncbi:MAG: DUF983 domain-containing protein [Bdellovibrionales bacterium]|nr:DUF983 domain-containing protein [Bdellovibrionales bacterium]